MTPRERKGLLVSKGVTMHQVSVQAGCSLMRVSEVVRGRQKFETPLTRKIKAVVSEMTGTPVTDLWPEPAEVAA